MEILDEDERINPVVFRGSMTEVKLLATTHIRRHFILVKGTNWGTLERSDMDDENDSEDSDD